MRNVFLTSTRKARHMEIVKPLNSLGIQKTFRLNKFVVIISLGKPIIVLLKIILTFLRKSYFIS